MLRIVHCSGYALGNDRELKKCGTVVRMPDTQSQSFNDWGTVCWGMDGLLGRVPKTVLVAKTTSADTIMWSTGSTHYKENDALISEAQRMYDTAYYGYGQLMEEFPHHFCKEGILRTEERYRAFIRSTSELDVQSKNTRTSMRVLAEKVDAWSGNSRAEVNVVTSVNHLPRVVRDAHITFIEVFGKKYAVRVSLVFHGADTCYGDGRCEDIIIKDLGR